MTTTLQRLLQRNNNTFHFQSNEGNLMALGKMLAKAAALSSKTGKRIAEKGAAVTKAGTDNANRYLPDGAANVVKSQREDLARIKTGLNAAVNNPKNERVRLTQQEAAGRAITRTAGRAAVVGGAGVAGYEGMKSKLEREDAKKGSDAPKRSSAPTPAPAPKKSIVEPPKAAAKESNKKDDKKKEKPKASKRFEAPKSSVREGKNENIDDDTRKRALASVANYNKGGMVKKGKC
jgi:hypothetical protein